ncbi:MAG: hypothetical protein OEY56_08390 [Cyclobacteriaceae bacterium]|nr:hypothetical protein [Cyclobacteriaceae bacterium]
MEVFIPLWSESTIGLINGWVAVKTPTPASGEGMLKATRCKLAAAGFWESG